MVVINKTDLLDAEMLARAIAAVERELRPGARIVRATQGAVDPAILLGLSAAAESDLDSRPSHPADESGHDHDDFDSFVLEIDAVPAPTELADRNGRRGAT